MKKKILLSVFVILLIMQFIRPTKNKGNVVANNTIHSLVNNDSVKPILSKACNDCHSNNTRYPWYSHIQPLGWWIASHINEGKKHLNFDEFNTYARDKQRHKIDEVLESIETDWMPLNSYTWMHKNSKLNESEKEIIKNWVNQLKTAIDSISK